jgi:hypothetical protein
MTIQQPTIMMFNKPSKWTLKKWNESRARLIMSRCPTSYVDATWVLSRNMTVEEKKAHPEHTITGGYLKTIKSETDRQTWWDNLSDDEKTEVMSLPNFDADVFYECTGIRVV